VLKAEAEGWSVLKACEAGVLKYAPPAAEICATWHMCNPFDRPHTYKC
jgi:hypothetical protein